MAEQMSTFDVPAGVEENKDASGDVVMQVPHDPLSQSVVENEFGFMQTLATHSACVRSLGTHPKGDILMSGSVDMTNKLYELDSQTGKYSFLREMKYHTGFVLDIIPMLTGEGFFSAGRDNKILQIDLEGNPIRELNGHTAAVNSMSQAIDGQLVSGSWDETAIKWDVESATAIEKMEGHAHAVAVLTLPNGITVTGSQDKAIRLWFQGKSDKVIENAHEDIVRGFTEVPELNAFASCSNDEIVKLWSFDGTHMMDLKGHTGFIFAIDTLESGEIVSGGDDCTVKIWKDGACKQTIQMPRSVWCITHNKFGDLLVGCEDKTIRIFTRDTKRQDKGKEFEEYETACKEGVKQAPMPEVEKLLEFSTEVKGKMEGKSEGEIKVFRDQGKAKAYMWKSAEKTWEEIGEVVDPTAANREEAEPAGSISMAGRGTKQYGGDALFAAGEYDHVFDVELGDGIMRKLPFNNGANFLEAADKFCTREGLSRSNVEQIVGFLRTHAKPFKTRDYDGTDAAKAEKLSKWGPKPSVIPFQSSIFYDAVKIEAPRKKILEFNEELKVLDEKDLIYFDQACKVLGQPQYFHSSDVGPAQIHVIKKLLSEFPSDKLFPVFDLYRIFLMHPHSSENFAASDGGSFYLSSILKHVEGDQPKATLLCALRCLCNIFKNQSSQHTALKRRQDILDSACERLYHEDKNVRQAAITLVLNFSANFLSQEDLEGRIQAISALSPAIESESDLQNLLRMTTALGNLCYENEEAFELLTGMGVTFPADLDKLSGADKDAAKNKQTIADIRAFLKLN